jgi:hypothetical protein
MMMKQKMPLNVRVYFQKLVTIIFKLPPKRKNIKKNFAIEIIGLAHISRT